MFVCLRGKKNIETRQTVYFYKIRITRPHITTMGQKSANKQTSAVFLPLRLPSPPPEPKLDYTFSSTP